LYRLIKNGDLFVIKTRVDKESDIALNRSASFVAFRSRHSLIGRLPILLQNTGQELHRSNEAVFAIRTNLLIIYKALDSLGWDDLGVVLFNEKNEYLLDSRLGVDASVYRSMIDPLRLQVASTVFERPGDVAIFTHVYNEGPMLQLWYDHYSKFVPDTALFLIDDGSNDGSLDNLPKAVNRLTIPRAKLDHYNMANYCSYFQRFLLQRYRFVISTDCDELLFFPKGISDFLDQLPSNLAGFKPEYAIAPIHNKELEPPFTWKSSPESWKSRQLYVNEIDMFLKPLVCRAEVTWGPGQHYSKETVGTAEGLVLLHAKFVDYDRLLESTRNWQKMQQTQSDEQFFGRVKELAAFQDPEEYVSLIMTEYADRGATKILDKVFSSINGTKKVKN